MTKLCRCEYYTRVLGKYVQLCEEPVAEVWISKSAEETSINGDLSISTPTRKYWCASHGIRGEARRAQRGDRTPADSQWQERRVLKEYSVLPIDKRPKFLQLRRQDPVCSQCDDTHITKVPGSMCTACPVPFDNCRYGTGPFCSETLCPCCCHPPHIRKSSSPTEQR